MNALTGQTSEIVAEGGETGTLTFSLLDAALLKVNGTEKTTEELECEFHAVKQAADETQSICDTIRSTWTEGNAWLSRRTHPGRFKESIPLRIARPSASSHAQLDKRRKL